MKFNSASVRPLFWPKSAVSLNCFLNYSCSHHFNAVPSEKGVISGRYAAIRERETRDVQGLRLTINAFQLSPSPLNSPRGSDIITKRRSVSKGMHPFISKSSSQGWFLPQYFVESELKGTPPAASSILRRTC